MAEFFLNALNDILTNPLVVLFALLGLAYGADRLLHAEGRILPISILAVAPPIGWIARYELPAEIRSLGLIMFIYVVGIETGGTFVPMFRRYWRRFTLIAVLASGGAAVLAWAIGHAFGWSGPVTASLYAGAVTSTPAFDLLPPTPGIPPVEARAIGAIFDLSYFVGILGAVAGVLLVHVFRTRRRGEVGGPVTFPVTEPEIGAPYYVSVHACTNRAIVGQPLISAVIRAMPDALPVRVGHGGEALPLTPETTAGEGDFVVLVSGSPRLTELARTFVGPAVDATANADLVRDLPVRFETVTVYSRNYVDRPVNLREIEEEFGVDVRGWWRGREYRPARPEMRWRLGDRLRVLGTPERVRAFHAAIEEKDRAPSEEIDLLRFSVGAVVAMAIAGIVVPVGGVRLSIGATGGALVAGLAFGRSARVQVPRGAGFFLKELGLGLFLAGIGTSVGVRGPIRLDEIPIVLAALVVTAVPVVAAVLLTARRAELPGQYVEGAVTGAATSTAALIVSTRLNDSVEPAVTYAGIYLIALLASVVAAQVIALAG